jgi:hypothetical protein
MVNLDMLVKLEVAEYAIVLLDQHEAYVQHYYKILAIERLIQVSILNQVTIVLLYYNRAA